MQQTQAGRAFRKKMDNMKETFCIFRKTSINDIRPVFIATVERNKPALYKRSCATGKN
ncbi:hypothetical protein ES705_49848 [subsurface metagenome]